jgi:hypothetical protein
MKKWGPWTQGKLNKLRYDIEGYFRAYYSELRKHIVEHDPDFQVLPLWFKGGREIQSQACSDGVMVVHRPYDEMSRTFTDRPDSYKGFLTPDEPVKTAVTRMIPPRPGGEIEISLLDYPSGQGFGAISYEEPVQLIHQLDADKELVEEVPWTRLDAADLDHLNIWQDKAEARQNARRLLEQYLAI